MATRKLQLARTRDTHRAKQSCTENFRRTCRTELITVATRLCRRATPSKSLPRPTPCRLAGCALCVNAPGVSLLGLHVASGCSLFSHASAIRLTSLGPPLLLAWRRSRRPVVTVTMSIGLHYAKLPRSFEGPDRTHSRVKITSRTRPSFVPERRHTSTTHLARGLGPTLPFTRPASRALMREASLVCAGPAKPSLKFSRPHIGRDRAGHG